MTPVIFATSFEGGAGRGQGGGDVEAALLDLSGEIAFAHRDPVGVRGDLTGDEDQLRPVRDGHLPIGVD